eukprot:CAMPEP_0174707090 /NCGR_PEP_ID=MMETSP1094-20130205/9706_1 /TAXON_ID=156173 /ORGANISM="Chrysochromulina brevifilum, Strain UTEX LB 985" /LENGTH=263 /DNA_ID=CAMNT_0015905427 /DNA_START=154 /DNA_END=947 /DNA_ORIENTATION=-
MKAPEAMDAASCCCGNGDVRAILPDLVVDLAVPTPRERVVTAGSAAGDLHAIDEGVVPLVTVVCAAFVAWLRKKLLATDRGPGGAARGDADGAPLAPCWVRARLHRHRRVMGLLATRPVNGRHIARKREMSLLEALLRLLLTRWAEAVGVPTPMIESAVKATRASDPACHTVRSVLGRSTPLMMVKPSAGCWPIWQPLGEPTSACMQNPPHGEKTGAVPGARHGCFASRLPQGMPVTNLLPQLVASPGIVEGAVNQLDVLNVF